MAKQFVLKDPTKEASGNQLYHLNKAGLLVMVDKPAKKNVITMGEASPALDVVFAKRNG